MCKDLRAVRKERDAAVVVGSSIDQRIRVPKKPRVNYPSPAFDLETPRVKIGTLRGTLVNGHKDYNLRSLVVSFWGFSI